MAARKTAIEFLPQEDWEKGILGKILKWALKGGRYIVIFTELIVILAFLSRFKLDRDLTDLGEEIKQKQAIVQASSQFEKEFRFLNKRLQTIDNLKKDQLEVGVVLEEIAKLIPVGVYLSDFSISKMEVSLNAISLSEGELAAFLRNLKNSPRFKNLSLSQINIDPEKGIGISFQIKGSLGSK